MISTSNITLRIGKKALFEDVNIKFTEGCCYGLIGANGAGKSTFLKILSGQLEPTSGEVIITPGQRLSFLQQDHFKYDEYTVLDTVIMGNKRLYDIMKEKDAIYMKEDFTDEDGIRAVNLKPSSQYGRLECRVRCSHHVKWSWHPDGGSLHTHGGYAKCLKGQGSPCTGALRQPGHSSFG